MDDSISRQAAIKALLEKGQRSRRYKLGEIWELNFDEMREVLNSLPSTEPEIIRCKDCRWGKEACGNIECWINYIPTEYHEYEWFCADGERRE